MGRRTQIIRFGSAPVQCSTCLRSTALHSNTGNAVDRTSSQSNRTTLTPSRLAPVACLSLDSIHSRNSTRYSFFVFFSSLVTQPGMSIRPALSHPFLLSSYH
ncbi:hypothetical protein BLNAU_257 [Blattamonas nauphoetae]|uniref:Uncharacterized protein n=1 Tax=Blattamonas nauphoetae TaxID=2049346 RepID=A0ABQ9YMP3_9EUKA|nr:hypothetical protein BLNAU_257 [Blattamonas nauphoetae]